MALIEHLGGAMRDLVDKTLARLADLGVRADWTDLDTIHGRAVSGILTISTGDLRTELPAVASPATTPADLALLPHDERTVLLTDRVTPARAQALRKHGWGGYVDSAGNASLRHEGIIIEVIGKRSAEPHRPKSTTAPFTRAGLPVTFALLLANESGFAPSQRTLATSSGASVGTVNRVVQALRDRTPPMLEGKSYQLLRPSAIEDEWISAYSAMQPSAWPEERFDSDIWQHPSDLLEAELPPGALLGSEAAAARLGAPIRPASALIHLDGSASERRNLIRQGRLRQADNGMVRIRPAFWKTLPMPPENGTAPRLLIRADLLLEDDPRVDEIRTQFFGVSQRSI